MKLSLPLLATALQFLAPGLVSGADTASWKSRSIYFALTDRIARSSNDNGGDACDNLGWYCGGTFKGLESKLDYIQGMGFDAIWITPVVENTNGGYHGYWAKDLYSINQEYGSADDLKSLVSAAHNKGIYVMCDVVANHMGPNTDVGQFRPEPLNQQSSYHDHCEIDYDDQNSVETCSLAGLPDIRTTDPEIRDVLQTWISWLIEEYSFDGLRIDTVMHVEKDFWPDFAWASGVYTMGEIWNGNPEFLAEYDNTMAGFLDYPIYYPMNRFFQQEGSSRDIADMHNWVNGVINDPAAWGTFIDNHDNNRWLNQKNDHSLLQNALAYAILSRGIPIVYYGTEQGYDGASDPNNREDLWRSGFNTDAPLYRAIARLNGAKKSAGGLAKDDQEHLHVEDSVYAWSREGGDLIVVTSNIGSGNNREYCFDSKVQNGSWNDVFNGDDRSYSSDGNGRLCVNVNNGLPVVLSSS